MFSFILFCRHRHVRAAHHLTTIANANFVKSSGGFEIWVKVIWPQNVWQLVEMFRQCYANINKRTNWYGWSQLRHCTKKRFRLRKRTEQTNEWKHSRPVQTGLTCKRTAGLDTFHLSWTTFSSSISNIGSVIFRTYRCRRTWLPVWVPPAQRTQNQGNKCYDYERLETLDCATSGRAPTPLARRLSLNVRSNVMEWTDSEMPERTESNLALYPPSSSTGPGKVSLSHLDRRMDRQSPLTWSDCFMK